MPDLYEKVVHQNNHNSLSDFSYHLRMLVFNSYSKTLGHISAASNKFFNGGETFWNFYFESGRMTRYISRNYLEMLVSHCPKTSATSPKLLLILKYSIVRY